MTTLPTLSVKWDHFGTFRRFELTVTGGGDIYTELLTKIRTTVPNFNDSLAWKGRQQRPITSHIIV